MGTMICSWNKIELALCDVVADGARLTNNLFSVGSGSVYACGVLDSGYNRDLTAKDSCELPFCYILQEFFLKEKKTDTYTFIITIKLLLLYTSQ